MAIMSSIHFWLIRPKIDYGGLGIHGDYHLKIVAETELKDCIGIFPTFPYEIWTAAQLITFPMIEDYLFD